MKRYPPQFVARVKTALFYGVPCKVMSRLTDVPFWTLVEWKQETRRGGIPPDTEIIEEVRLAFRKEI